MKLLGIIRILFRNMFFTNKNSILIFFLIKNLSLLTLSDFTSTKYCQIRSRKFTFEYLMNVKNSSQSLLDLKPSVFTYPLNKIDDMNRMFWWIIPVVKPNISSSMETNDLFYIRNYENGEYICATKKFQKILIARFKQSYTDKRLLQTIDRNHLKENNKLCQWKFDKIINRQKNFEVTIGSYKLRNSKEILPEYIITNSAFDQKLYVGSDKSKFDSHQRKVYLIKNSLKTEWTNNQFKWIVDCALPKIKHQALE